MRVNIIGFLIAWLYFQSIFANVRLNTVSPGMLEVTLEVPPGYFLAWGLGFSGRNTYARWAVVCTRVDSMCIAYTCVSSHECSKVENISFKGRIGSYFSFVRSFTSTEALDPGLVIGINNFVTTTGIDTQNSNDLVENRVWTRDSRSISMHYGDLMIPKLPSLSMYFDTLDTVTLRMTFSRTNNIVFGLGWSEHQNDYPKWAMLCTTAPSCVEITCVSKSACNSVSKSKTTQEVYGMNVFIRRKAFDLQDISIKSGEQKNLLWLMHSKALNQELIAVAQDYNWGRFEQVQSIREYIELLFVQKIRYVTSDTVSLTVTLKTGQYGALGWINPYTPGAAFPSYGILCYSLSSRKESCLLFTCKTSSMCARVTKQPTNLVRITEETFQFVIPTGTQQGFTITGGKQQALVWHTGTLSGNTPDITWIQNILWISSNVYIVE